MTDALSCRGRHLASHIIGQVRGRERRRRDRKEGRKSEDMKGRERNNRQTVAERQRLTNKRTKTGTDKIKKTMLKRHKIRQKNKNLNG